jgi:signal transduction histidine kinase
MQLGQLRTWLVMALVTVLIGGSLFGIVNSASHVIERQQAVLRKNIDESEAMSQENRRLRARAERANSRVAEITEANLRRISADLHDGPAQLVSLAALRLDALRNATSRSQQVAELDAMGIALKDAIREIRNISRGLSLPDLAAMSLASAAERAVRAHEALTSVAVERMIDIGESQAPMAAKACLYRFIQEGLNNAYRHASAANVRLETKLAGSRLSASIGNGPPREKTISHDGGGMGLMGLKERIESLGGSFQFARRTDGGADLAMELDLAGGAFHD